MLYESEKKGISEKMSSKKSGGVIRGKNGRFISKKKSKNYYPEFKSGMWVVATIERPKGEFQKIEGVLFGTSRLMFLCHNNPDFKGIPAKKQVDGFMYYWTVLVDGHLALTCDAIVVLDDKYVADKYKSPNKATKVENTLAPKEKFVSVVERRLYKREDCRTGMRVRAILTHDDKIPHEVEGILVVFGGNVYLCHNDETEFADKDDSRKYDAFHGINKNGMKYSWNVFPCGIEKIPNSDCQSLFILSECELNPKKVKTEEPKERRFLIKRDDFKEGMKVRTYLCNCGFYRSVEGEIYIASDFCIYLCHNDPRFNGKKCMDGFQYSWAIMHSRYNQISESVELLKDAPVKTEEPKERLLTRYEDCRHGMKVRATLNNPHGTGNKKDVEGIIWVESGGYVIFCHSDPDFSGGHTIKETGLPYGWCVLSPNSKIIVPNDDCLKIVLLGGGVESSPTNKELNKPEVMEYRYEGSTYRKDGRIGGSTSVSYLEEEIKTLKDKITRNETLIANWKKLFREKQ